VAAGQARVVSRATYWRLRAVVAVMVVVLVLVMAQAGAALGGSTPAAPERHPAGHAAVEEAGHRTVVRPGDSLWSVAVRLVPGEDPRPVVDALAEARHGAVLTPGETIRWDG
jgi:hypothetical protein